jgi:four helix bundle protein
MFQHELEERCFQFARRVREFCRKLKRTIENIEDIKQVVRSSGSIGANYIEANEKMGLGDLKYRLRVSRKEAKETVFFLGLFELFEGNDLEQERNFLIDEANQLRKIFSAMLLKLESRSK